jgi:tRNA uridine 5-carboxymethylaminomethyl modification enzyme
LTVGRFKTGTPPRVDGRSVDLSILERQDSELQAFRYKWSAFGDATTDQTRRAPDQMSCWITYAGESTKALVSAHLTESAMYGGAIGARGPRYCPSIEDKIVRFPDASRHQVFLEPEGQNTRELYVNGLSTSLPAHVQLEMLHTVPGLEHCEMTRPGYAIEYDYFPPTQLDATLAVRAIAGLWFAGQINGTTGYEEAGGQGVVAGLNAALHAGEREPFVFGRETSYIGVLVDDLVTRGVDEPYRLFTSRSEFRLTVRHDNSLRRLAPIGRHLGIYDAFEERIIDSRSESVERAMQLSKTTTGFPEQVDPVLLACGSSPLSHGVRLIELAKRQNVSLASLFAAVGVGADLPLDSVTSTELEIKYAGYLRKERDAAERLHGMGAFALPTDAPYHAMRTLSAESREKLAAVRPHSLAQASSVPGVTPADLQNLILEIERLRSVGAG